MLASELIKELQLKIDKHGDTEVANLCKIDELADRNPFLLQVCIDVMFYKQADDIDVDLIADTDQRYSPVILLDFSP